MESYHGNSTKSRGFLVLPFLEPIHHVRVGDEGATGGATWWSCFNAKKGELVGRRIDCIM